MWANPLSDVMGNWGLYNEKGELTTEAIENVMLMLSFITLLLWTFKDQLLEKVSISSTAWIGIKFSFLFSISLLIGHIVIEWPGDVQFLCSVNY